MDGGEAVTHIRNTLANDLSKPSNIFADNLLHKLKQENWNEEEQPCWESMSKLLEGANNNIIWSTWVLDSMQLPVGALYGSRYHLGNFDQCLDNTWSSSHPELETQYCLVNLIAEEVAAAQFSPYDDVEAFIKDLETTVGFFLSHLDVLVDSFFALSGLLLVRGLCTSKSFTFWTTISKRYKRFITPYIMILLYMMSVSPHTGSGPLWPKYLKEQQEPCSRNWWSGLLMMGNFINNRDICYVVTWYLSCDFQLTILGVIAFYFWKRSVSKRVFMVSIGLALFVAIPAFQSYHYKLTHILLYDLDEALDISLNDTVHKIYLQFYNRASSYLIGYATGYIMTVYKPEQNRKVLSKTFSIICSLVIALMVGSMLYATGSLMFKKYDGIRFAVYAGFDRVIWSVGVCGVIILCEYGTLPIVTDLLSSKVFVPLSRLSYGLYLIHMAIIYRNVYSLRAPITYDFVHLVIHGLGYVVISCVFSYLQWFIIEAPAANLFNYLQVRQNHGSIRKKLIASAEKWK